jgi:hypothetical protein
MKIQKLQNKIAEDRNGKQDNEDQLSLSQDQLHDAKNKLKPSWSYDQNHMVLSSSQEQLKNNSRKGQPGIPVPRVL